MEVLNTESVDTKAEILHNMVLNKLDECCPQKTRKMSIDDEPWFTDKLKQLNRKVKREFNNNRNSPKYKKMKKAFYKKMEQEKRKFK